MGTGWHRVRVFSLARSLVATQRAGGFGLRVIRAHSDHHLCSFADQCTANAIQIPPLFFLASPRQRAARPLRSSIVQFNYANNKTDRRRRAALPSAWSARGKFKSQSGGCGLLRAINLSACCSHLFLSLCWLPERRRRAANLSSAYAHDFVPASKWTAPLCLLSSDQR